MQVMIITYLGKQFFKIQRGDLTIALNPISKNSKHNKKISTFGANIVLINVNHPDFNGIDTVTYGDTKPFVISGPGDYEINGIFIKGIMTDGIIDGKKCINTIYSLVVDNINLCFLGSLFSKELTSEAREEIDNPDILFTLVGGSLNSSESYKLSTSFSPKVIIPMYYNDQSLKTFLKEGGEEKIEMLDKLTIKKKDLEEKDDEIIVLNS